jgi:hypothetical protein
LTTINIETSSSGANPTATAGPTAINGSAATFMRSDAAPAIQKASSSQFGIVEVDGTTITSSAGVISAVSTGSTGANPTATASDVAVNGSATTFMRSDGAPAVQKTSSSVFGLAKVDGTSITAAAGVISATGSSGANPTATASDTAVNGSASTFLRSDGAPAIQLGSSSVKGVVQVDGTTITAMSGVLTATGAGSSPTGNTLSAEILADAPTGYWKCNDTSGSTIVDSSGGGFDLTTTGTPTLAYASLVPTETAAFLRIKHPSDGASRTSALGTSPPLGDLSFGCIVTPETLVTDHLIVFSLGLDSTAVAANNFQFFFYFDANNSYRPTVLQEHGSRVSENVTCGTFTSILPVVYRPAFWHVVRDATAKTILFYRNGVPIGTAAASYVNAVTGGTGSIQARIGTDGVLNTALYQVAHVAIYVGVKLSGAAGLIGS